MNSAPTSSPPWRARQLQRAGRLRPHGDRQPAAPRPPRLGDLDPLIEGHGGEIAGGAAGQQRAVLLGDAVVEQEAHVAPGRREIELEVGVAEHGRHGDVAAFEPALGSFEIHGRPQPIRRYSGRAPARH